MAISLDWSGTTFTMVKCSHCPFWFGYADDRAHGWKVGAAHENSVHPGEGSAYKNASRLRPRTPRDTPQIR